MLEHGLAAKLKELLRPVRFHARPGATRKEHDGHISLAGTSTSVARPQLRHAGARRRAPAGMSSDSGERERAYPDRSAGNAGGGDPAARENKRI